MEDPHKLVYDKIVKRHKSTNSVHVVSLVSYLIDILLLLVNVVIHCLNRAYVALTITVFIHLAATVILALLYNANETEIDEGNTNLDSRNPNKPTWVNCRKLSKWFGLTPLFRIIVNWKDHGELHSHVREQQKFRNDITLEEVRKTVLMRKRLLVNSYFDAIYAYFKMVPQCLLLLFITLDLNLPLRFCGLSDLARFVTMIASGFMAARTSASYTSHLSDYLNLLRIHDNLEYRAKNVTIVQMPLNHLWFASFLANTIVVFSRVYAIGFLISSSRHAAVPPFVMIIIFFLNLLWIRIRPDSRLSYENPPKGILTIYSETVDRFMNIFSIHTVVGSIKTMVFHQSIFVFTFVFILVGIHVTLHGETLWAATFSNVNCNFSIFSDSGSNFARALHVLLNDYGESDSVVTFRDIFSLTTCAILFILSFLATLSYTLYLEKISLSKDDSFPLSVSIKCWQRFLEKNWSDVGKVEGVKILLLGILPSSELEFYNYKFPNDMKSLKEVLQDASASDELNFHSEGYLLGHNPCEAHLRSLQNYLSDIEETGPLCEYFIKHFDLCMGQMTSHRIAQTSNVILDKKSFLYSFLANFKSFGLKL